VLRRPRPPLYFALSLPSTITFRTLLKLQHIDDAVHETSVNRGKEKDSGSVHGQIYCNTKMQDTRSAKTALCYTLSDSFTSLRTKHKLFSEIISRQNAVKWDSKLNIRPY